MLILRATQKVLRLLPQSAAATDISDTALGDWYINRVVVNRQPLLLCVSARSLFALLAPARDIKSLPERFPGMVAERLRRLGVDESFIASELEAMRTKRVGRTQDRSVVGTMVDFAKAIPYYLTVNEWDGEDLRLTEEQLWETPCLCSSANTIWPKSETLRLLTLRWSDATTIP